ncbi:MAG: M23 family metallopeptidase [Elusimicrobiota bacterium]|nr:M23 family metallopeptidase [Elusimicrobiota bacterium]
MQNIALLLFIATLNIFAAHKNYLRRTNFEYLWNNQNLYLFNETDGATEQYLDHLRQKIVANIERLIVVNWIYDPAKDNLYTLAKKFNTNVASIRSTNYIEAVGLLYRGKILLLHNKKGMLYRVPSDGVEVSAIAKKFNKKIEEICQVNEITPTCKLKKGDLIFLPDVYIKFKDFMLPLFNTRITSKFGLRKHPIFGILKYHEGIDLKQRYGAAVRAACDGKVIFAGWAEGYGKLVIIKHQKGYTTYYGHLSKIRVKVGQWVNKGQIIGNVGMTGWTTGPHLHFEVRKNGVPINPKKVLF